MGYKRGIDFSNWFFLIFFTTLGATVGAVVLPSIIGVLSGFIGCLFLGKRIIGINEETGDLYGISPNNCVVAEGVYENYQNRSPAITSIGASGSFGNRCS